MSDPSTTHSMTLDLLAKALCAAQSQVEGAKKDSENPYFRSKYADLSSVWLACREALHSNGLSVVQSPGFENGVVTLTTILLHESGQWIQGTAGAPAVGKSKDGVQLPPDAQSVGSALTYLRRYALAAIAGVVQEDDDGEAAVKPSRQTKPAPKPAETAPAPLSEMPAALKEDLDNDLPLEGQELADLLKLVAAAGVTKVGFREFYTRVMGKLYDKVIRIGDVKAIRAEASKLLAQKGRKT